MVHGAQEPPDMVGHGPRQGHGGCISSHSFLCPQRAKPTGARYPRVNGEASVLFPIIHEKGRAEG